MIPVSSTLPPVVIRRRVVAALWLACTVTIAVQVYNYLKEQ